LSGKKSAHKAQEAMGWLFRSLSGDASVRRDERRLKRILKQDITVLCAQTRKLNARHTLIPTC
jgi:hypothetical protein